MSRVRSPQDEWSRLNALEARLAKLERSNALALAAIPNPSGAAGDFVLATQLAYGLAGQTVTTSESYGSSTAWGDMPSGTVGPEAQVTIGPSGRALVLGIATSAPSRAGSAGMVGVSLDGADPAAVLQATASTAALQSDNTLISPDTMTVMEVVTGLSAGSHLFKMVYRIVGSTGTSGTAFWNRSLVVWPF